MASHYSRVFYFASDQRDRQTEWLQVDYIEAHGWRVSHLFDDLVSMHPIAAYHLMFYFPFNFISFFFIAVPWTIWQRQTRLLRRVLNRLKTSSSSSNNLNTEQNSKSNPKTCPLFLVFLVFSFPINPSFGFLAPCFCWLKHKNIIEFLYYFMFFFPLFVLRLVKQKKTSR